MNKRNKDLNRDPIGTFTPSLILYGDDVMDFYRRTKYNIQNFPNFFNRCIEIYGHMVNTLKSTSDTSFISHHMLFTISGTLGFSIITLAYFLKCY